ncbi:DUF6869 domain-containing protein [Thalassovita mangrovi]|uniref:DUF6869 domain-containing protein n=1 Tax=Thalassovita mangrovi TaxID=2692236 RepID=A0A6L8LN78_9RHOB|nr:hypothetical protein [Thalassovita mangrovi]MYM56010.1 hypothetical protein [Thalassovita mangrovi]
MTQEPPPCIFCYGKEARPCAPEGLFDVSWVAHSYLEHIARSENHEAKAEALFWSYNCISDLVEDTPEIAFQIVLILADGLTSPRQASIVAAGFLEDIIVKHGPTFIDRIEEIAYRSPRFRYVLSGVWPQGEQDSAVWKRIAAIRENGPHIDKDSVLPPPDGVHQ